jgi:mannose-1-phosphate guanylyltransferase
MKAVILVGGKATRLEPLSIYTPKALMPVLNVPLLEYVVRNLARYQMQDIVLALGNLAKPITDNFGDGSQFGVRLFYSIEDTPLGSAGAVKKAEEYLGDTFLVINGDNFIDLDYLAMIKLHRERKAQVTIALTRVDDPTRYGLVETDTLGRVIRFLEKPKLEEVTTNTVNAGAWLVEPGVLSRIPSGKPLSFERNVFPELLSYGEPVYAYISSGYWMDTGTPELYLRLHRDLFAGKSVQYQPTSNISIDRHTEISQEAKLIGPVVIGANCSIGRGVKIIGPVVIGDGCTILENTVIEGSIIWRNVRLGPRVILKNCILADNCHINQDSVCEDLVLGDNVTLAIGSRLKPGSKINPGTTIKPE